MLCSYELSCSRMPQRPCGEAGFEKRIDLLVARCVVTGTSRCTERVRPSRSFLPSSGRGRRRARAHTHPRTRGERVTSARRVSRGLLGRLRDENPTTQPGRSSMPSEHLPRAGCAPGTLLGPRSQCSLSGAPVLEKDSDEQTRAEGGAVSTGSVYTGGNPPCLQGPGRCWSQDPRSRRYIATLG